MQRTDIVSSNTQDFLAAFQTNHLDGHSESTGTDIISSPLSLQRPFMAPPLSAPISEPNYPRNNMYIHRIFDFFARHYVSLYKRFDIQIFLTIQ